MYYPDWDGAYNITLAANKKNVAHVLVAVGFISRVVLTSITSGLLVLALAYCWSAISTVLP